MEVLVVDSTPKKPTLKQAKTPQKKGPGTGLDADAGKTPEVKKSVTWADFYKKPRRPHPTQKRGSNGPPSLLLTSEESFKHIESVSEKTLAKELKQEEDEAFKKEALKHRNKQERERKRIQTHGYGAPKLAAKRRLTAAVKTGKKIGSRV